MYFPVDGSLAAEAVLPLLRGRFGRPYEHVDSTPRRGTWAPRPALTGVASHACAEAIAAITRLEPAALLVELLERLGRYDEWVNAAR